MATTWATAACREEREEEPAPRESTALARRRPEWAAGKAAAEAEALAFPLRAVLLVTAPRASDEADMAAARGGPRGANTFYPTD